MDMSPVVESHPPSSTGDAGSGSGAGAGGEGTKPRTNSAAARAKRRWTKAVNRVTLLNVATRKDKRACCSCCVCFRDPKDRDAGIPQICLKYDSCPFNPNNHFLAKSRLALMFSNIGYKFFDKYRRVFQGLAFVWTLVGFFVTCIACLALINDTIILRTVHWASGATFEGILPPKGFNYSAIFIGLRGYNFVSCKNTSAPILKGYAVTYDSSNNEIKEPKWELSTDVYGTGSDFDCFSEVYPWDYNTMDEGLDQEWAGKCAYSCAATIFTALSSCGPMIFAMIGALNRMNKHSDAPQQKMLGCITDTIGAVTLCLALLSFERGCFDDMGRENVDFEYVKNDVSVPEHFDRIWWGRGSAYWVFWIFCFSGACLRALVHWLTPCPGLGIGFMTWRLPTGEDIQTQLVGRARAAKEKTKRAGRKVKDKARAVKQSVILPAGAKGKAFLRNVSSVGSDSTVRSGGGESGAVGDSFTITEGDEEEEESDNDDEAGWLDDQNSVEEGRGNGAGARVGAGLGGDTQL
ncbi:hypothetical protein TrVE_jg10970 [Triparma verrucosa]|uniref:Uncharacterized protein n=1 Tax=Triparma verrucosa TaxID=1606542 RepID=A0A9W7KXF8_9STRA|nr:hypothetical protein TrVE_jg10970 [Triparma verrucosa]